MVVESPLIETGTLSFTIESRLLRELGERLVKEPEVAIVELIKNAYDADATECEVAYEAGASISVKDNGVGMTLARFTEGWMRIGTSAKEETATSPIYGRRITGEKGIGRFAVRFLGGVLRLESVAVDELLGQRTQLLAEFDWHQFDEHSDLGEIEVPYSLTRVEPSVPTGTSLSISKLRDQAGRLDLRRIRTDSLGVLNPLRSLFEALQPQEGEPRLGRENDPGLELKIQTAEEATKNDVAAAVLDAFVLRATIDLEGSHLKLQVYRQGQRRPYLSVVDKYHNDVGRILADIRFFPRRKGTFAGSSVDGRRGYSWVLENAGVAVFDRDFRVQPYGAKGDDWLQLAADNARNRREPRSSIARKHFPMSSEVRADTKQNWMLRLPQSAQLVGLVQVEGRRGGAQADADSGLVASADREGFVENQAFRTLVDIVRGAIEALAQSDRRLQREEAEATRAALLESIRAETRAAIVDIESSPTIAKADKSRIVAGLLRTQELVEQREDTTRERMRQLEVMSLLGIVAGFMTHEFGAALQELKEAQSLLLEFPDANPRCVEAASRVGSHIDNLTEFYHYSTAYIGPGKSAPPGPYAVKPRIRQVIRIFGHYASQRHIDIQQTIDKDLMAPLVPVSLYNGVVLNLYTNALKAVTARAGPGPRIIAFRAWNEPSSHYLEVSDTGIGIPSTLREAVFEPLFTTTDNRRDPLGSGMGLGLALARRVVEEFGGRVDVVDPPPQFVTCVRVRLPLSGDI